VTATGADLPIDRTGSGIAFWIHVTPRARNNRVGGTHGDALRVDVRATPVAGKANAACTAALADALGEPKASVQLPAGSRGRRKRVEVSGDAAALCARLRLLATAARVR
jgi:hypothetical protein